MIADSAVVETYLLTKSELAYLPDSELKRIQDFIALQKEPDRPDREDIVEAQFQDKVAWEQIKIDKTQAVYE